MRDWRSYLRSRSSPGLISPLFHNSSSAISECRGVIMSTHRNFRCLTSFRLRAHLSWRSVTSCRWDICFGHGVTEKWRGRIRGRRRAWNGRRLRHHRRIILQSLRSYRKNLMPTTRRPRNWRKHMPEVVIAAPIKHQFDTAEQQREAATMGMWLFLATEVLLFGGMFLGYTIYRVSYPQAFAEASRHTLVVFGSINTAILLSSSCVMAFAVRAARANRSGALALLLLVTALLGAVFLGIKGVEYSQEISERLLPGGGFHIEASDP